MERTQENRRTETERRETYLERELRHNRENNPAMWSYAELLRRIEEQERKCGGQPF
jgi:aminoglycoside phosphotransferase family enzyme